MMKPTHRKRLLKPLYPVKKIRLSVMNAHLICSLCGGYLIHATSITQCMHSFCRTCILTHFKKERSCPLCLTIVHDTKPQDALAYDFVLQKLVYKMVPGLLSREMNRIKSFYQGLSISRQSSRDTDSSEETETDSIDHPNLSEGWCLMQDTEPISVCLSHVTFSSYLSSSNISPTDSSVTKPRPPLTSPTNSQDNSIINSKGDVVSPCYIEGRSVFGGHLTQSLEDIYLLCPGKATVNQLLKLIRLKYDLSPQQEVVLCLSTDFLEPTHSLLELAYIYRWDRRNVMHFAFVIIPDKHLSEQ